MQPATKSVQLYDIEAEKMLLASLMLDTTLIEQLGVSDNIFYRQSHKIIFNAIVKFKNDNVSNVDNVLLAESLRTTGQLDSVGGVMAVMNLCNLSPSSNLARNYFSIVKKYSIKRELLDFSAYLTSEANELEFKDDDYPVMEYFDKLQNIFLDESSDDTSADKDLEDFALYTMHRMDNDINGLSLGIPRLDYLLKGLESKTLNIIAGNAGMGKTAFAVQAIVNTAKKGKVIAFFSLEMSKEEVYQRIIACHTGIELDKIVNPSLMSQNELKQFWQAIDVVKGWKLKIYDSPAIKPSFVAQKCYKLKAKHGGLDLILIDHLQIMTADGVKNIENTNLVLSAITSNLKSLAKRLVVPILALSQFNRAKEKQADKRPTLADLRGSGTIEENSDTVMLMYRDDYYADSDDSQRQNAVSIIEIDIRKNRQGQTGVVKIGFDKAKMRFREIDLNHDSKKPKEEDKLPFGGTPIRNRDIPVITTS